MIILGINVEKALADIAENCVQLRSLSVAYLGLSSWQPTAWPPLLEDLRYCDIVIFLKFYTASKFIVISLKTIQRGFA